jgi:ABC-type multidrug transport system ATPase subunit
MTIELQQLGKRFKNQWVFRGLTDSFSSGECIGITGPNGSGKSTLLKILSGYSSPSEGWIQFHDGEQEIAQEAVHRHVSLATPYMELIEEFTMDEMIRFQERFKPRQEGVSMADLQNWLPFGPDKLIRDYSSGMRQRLKLVLALTANSDVLLLDEPTSNLDRQGQEWYKELLTRFKNDRLIFIASNQEEEYADFAQRQVSILDFKAKPVN